jgi:hypothetical protein
MSGRSPKQQNTPMSFYQVEDPSSDVKMRVVLSLTEKHYSLKTRIPHEPSQFYLLEPGTYKDIGPKESRFSCSDDLTASIQDFGQCSQSTQTFLLYYKGSKETIGVNQERRLTGFCCVFLFADDDLREVSSLLGFLSSRRNHFSVYCASFVHSFKRFILRLGKCSNQSAESCHLHQHSFTVLNDFQLLVFR